MYVLFFIIKNFIKQHQQIEKKRLSPLPFKTSIFVEFKTGLTSPFLAFRSPCPLLWANSSMLKTRIASLLIKVKAALPPTH